MITTRNEFETIPAFEVLAGSSLGTWTPREICAEMIRNVNKCTQMDVSKFWIELAEMSDDDPNIGEIIQDCIYELNSEAPIPPSCAIEWRDGEILVLPYIDDEIPRFEDVPESHVEDVVYQVSDHGNVECYSWDYNRMKYVSEWGMA